MNIQDLYGLSTSLLGRFGLEKDTGFIAGAELEIEAVMDYSRAYMENNYIQCELDGSLRNDGREFLLPPSPKQVLVELFRGVHEVLDLGIDPYSVRTSTHVHVNCMQNSTTEVKTLLLLYAIFEPLAFSYVGEERRNNIHCMPLGSTHMPNYYNSTLENIVERWHKYTAFNLLPLRDQGTVEFRHLGGTDDAERFETWLDFIQTLWYHAKMQQQIVAADLVSLGWLREIQQELMTPRFLANCLERPQFILEDNLLDVKLAFI